MSYIYKTTNLITNKIYIGQSTKQGKSYIGGGKVLKNSIKKHGKKNFKKEIIIEGNFNKELLNDLEKHYIRLFNSTNKKIGYNITEGGNADNSEFFKKFHRERKRKKSTNRKISKALTGKVPSKETRLKQSLARIGRFRGKDNKTSKAINQYTKNNEHIKTFDSINIASIETGILRTSINNCLNKRSKSAGNFIWKYK